MVISSFNFLALSLSHHDNMPNLRTPPHSQDASNGRFSSKQTPLKHDRLGSQAHSSGPPPKASTLYKEMTREACEKFVGPMPVKKFLSEFVPKSAKKRPSYKFSFDHSSASQNENEFVSRLVSKGIDRRSRVLYRLVQWKHLVFAPSSRSSTPDLVEIFQKKKAETGHLHLLEALRRP